MLKSFSQLFFILVLFFSTWFLLSKIDWMKHFKIQIIQESTEKKIGDLIWESTKITESEITSINLNKSIDSIAKQICISNGIEFSTIKIHCIQKEELNAFALPDNHLVIYSSLIARCENSSELAGVIAHEIAHMQLHHIMKKLRKEIGLSILLSATGNNNPVILQKAVKLLSSSAYDRSLETEADVKAIDYLTNAKIDPKGLATFLMKLAENEGELMSDVDILSTHPASKERANLIQEKASRYAIKYHDVIHPTTWIKLQESVQTEW
jgi:beta-barrel assembly-enhancing protease